MNPPATPSKFSSGAKCIAVVVGLACAGLFAADFAYHKHPHFPFEKWTAFYAGYGLLAALGAALAGRVMRRLLLRDEDYYDR